MRHLLFALLLVVMAGCGPDRKPEDQSAGKSSDVAVAAATDHASHSAAGASDAPVTPGEIENRQEFIGDWGEIDADEKIRFSERGIVSISGGEMTFRGRYRVTQKGIVKLSLDGLGGAFGTVTGTLSASGDELVIVTEIAPDEPSRYRRRESPPSSGKPGNLRNSPQATAAIDAAIRNSLDKQTGDITEADLAKVTSLDLASLDIVDLTPLAGMTELEFLNLNGNWIIDLAPLAGLTKLKVLGLTDNRITDPAPLAAMTALKDLRLNGNKISDLKALAGMTDMKLLQLDGNQITDLSPLESLRQTRFIELQDNPNLTRAEIDRLQKLLAQCTVNHNAGSRAPANIDADGVLDNVK